MGKLLSTPHLGNRNRRISHVDFFKSKGLLKQATFLENPADGKLPPDSPIKFGSIQKQGTVSPDKRGSMINAIEKSNKNLLKKKSVVKFEEDTKKLTWKERFAT